MLSITGKNKAALKGALTGQLAWQSLYGVMAAMGATRIQEFPPSTVLTEFISHTVYGTIAASIAAKLGDEGFFNGQIHLSVSPIGQLHASLSQALIDTSEPGTG
ncbi:MAG: hypothetical protein Q7J85_14110 [Bacillota bacterium]|nr:hypothetical protein [Bacillota bacterium]